MRSELTRFSMCRFIKITYLVVLVVLLLWPFDFIFPFQQNNHVEWMVDSNGVAFLSRGQILSQSSPVRLHQTLIAGHGLTLEAWLSSEDKGQHGPARIVSYSLNPSLQNFMLGQEGSDLVVRLRTTQTNLKGTNPEFVVENVFLKTGFQHIVVTYNFLEQRVYVDGELRLQVAIPGGGFDNWDPSYPLVLGNEATGNREWLGKLSLLAIYDHPLNEQEVRQNYLMGRTTGLTGAFNEGRASRGLTAFYLFDEQRGTVIRDQSGGVPPLNLYIPEHVVADQNKRYLGIAPDYESFMMNASFLKDVVLNVLAFIPLGVIFYGFFSLPEKSPLKAVVFSLMLGLLFTVGIESLQFYMKSRFSSLIDVVSNTAGISLGIVTGRFEMRFRKFLLHFKINGPCLDC